MSINRKYRYNAFISYRHRLPDMAVAKQLHTLLERFKVPKELMADAGLADGINRIFRDEEELPTASDLGAAIEDALQDSEHLLIICTPELLESKWCMKEVETFLGLRGSEYMHPILVAGDYESSVPEVLRKLNIPVIDVRKDSKSDIDKNVKSKYLEIAAALLGIDRETLISSCKDRNNKRIIRIASIITAVSLSFSIFSIGMGIYINHQKTELAGHQAKALAMQSEEALENDDRHTAVSLAYQALTKYNHTSMPYTDEAREALFDAVMPYNQELPYREIEDLYLENTIADVLWRDDTDTFVIIDSFGGYTLVDMAKRESLFRHSAVKDDSKEWKDIVALNNLGDLVYMDNGDVIYVDAKTGNPETRVENMDKKMWGMYWGHKTMLMPYKKLSDGELYLATDTNVEVCVSYWPDGEVFFASDDENVAYRFESEGEYGICIIGIGNENRVRLSAFTPNMRMVKAVFDDACAYVLYDTYVINNDMECNSGSYVAAYSLSSGELVWDYYSDDTDARDMTLLEGDNTECLVAITQTAYVVLDVTNGHKITHRTMDNTYIGKINGDYASRVYLLDANGHEYGTAIEDGQVTFSEHDRINIRLTGISRAFYSSNNYVLVVIPENSNRIVFYKASRGPDMEDGDIIIDNDKVIMSVDVPAEVAQHLNIDAPDQVNCLYEVPDSNMVILSYNNGTKAIYNSMSGTVTESWQDECTLSECLGPDINNNYYLIENDDSGNITARMISTNLKLIGTMENLCGMNKDGTELMFEAQAGKAYHAPVYNTEDLLEIARGWK